MNVCKSLVLPTLAVGWVGVAVTVAAANPYFSAVLRDSPALYWTFDEGSGTALNYGYLPGGNLGAEATRGTSTTTAGGASLGLAAQFDGSTRFSTSLPVGSVPLGGEMQSYVIEMWVQSSAPTTSNQYLMEVFQGDGNRPAVIYNFEGPQALEVFGGGGRTGAGGPTALADGQWHRVVMGLDAQGGNHSFIIDGGVPQTFTGFDRAFRADGSHIYLGGTHLGGLFTGSIDEMAVYDLSGMNSVDFNARMSQIAGHRNISADSPVPGTMTAYTWEVLKANPRFYWNFNEPSPQGNAVDLVRGQANDELTAYGGARRKLGASENLGLTAAFDGADHFAASALGDGEMPGAWAVEMWLQADGSLDGNRSDYLLNVGNNNNNPALIYDFDYGGGDTNKIELYSAAGRTAGNGPSVGDNDWHHVVATFYGNGAGLGVADRVDFAVDGVVMANVGRNGFSSRFDLNTTLRIGAALAAGEGGFQGKIDEVAFYDLSGLTEAQVAARTAQLASHYHLLNEPAATALRFVEREQISYTYVTPPHANYPDSSGRKLLDGVIGSTGTGLVSADWAGIENADPQITFDLGSPMPLDSIWIDYLAGGRWGIHAPTSLDVLLSLDGINFGDPLTFTHFNNAGSLDYFWNRRLIAEMGGAYGRYVRLDFTRGGDWTFLGEVQFVVPEPGAGLLLLSALGCALLVRRRRSKQ